MREIEREKEIKNERYIDREIERKGRNIIIPVKGYIKTGLPLKQFLT